MSAEMPIADRISAGEALSAIRSPNLTLSSDNSSLFSGTYIYTLFTTEGVPVVIQYQ